MARVLVVEDEPTDRVLLATLLDRMGHSVHLAADGEEAFKSYLKNGIEVVVTDLNMPHVDGLEFIEAVRELFPEAEIIVVSGKGRDQLDAALNAGARAALGKPVQPQELQKAVAEAARDVSGREEAAVEAPDRANDQPLILIVEDSPDDAALIEAAFKKHLAQCETRVVFDGWQAQAYLNRKPPYHDWSRHPAPSLIVLDIGLPDMTGLEILEQMAESRWLETIPVVVLTASTKEEHEQRAYALGVRAYMRKPTDYGALVDRVRAELYLSEAARRDRDVAAEG